MTEPRPSSVYAWYVCALMTACYAFDFMDRAVLNLLLIPIEKDFNISDSQAGLLIGGAFAICFAIAAVPIASLSDRGDRRRLIAAGTTIWCLATVGCGLARTVPLLFLSRMFVAIGEAVLIPAATSLLADFFPPAKRVLSLSVFSMGIYLGGGLSYVGGGVLFKRFTAYPLRLHGGDMLSPWRTVLLALGVAGLALVPLLWWLREPLRVVADHESLTNRLAFSTFLRQQPLTRKVLLLHYAGFGMMTLAYAATTVWMPAIFIRTHGWRVSEAGLRLGLIALILGPLGAICGSMLSNTLARQGHADAKFLVGIVSGLGCAVASFASTLHLLVFAIAGVAILQFLISFIYGVLHAALTDLVPNYLRARAVALFGVVTNVISITIGPLAVAFLTDHLFHDQAAVAVSLRLVAPAAFLISAGILARGLLPYRQTVALSYNSPRL